MFKQQKGITLIALVITIIVLLILAGVTIAMLTGGDSAPAKANEAKQKNDIGTARDQVFMTAQDALLTYYDETYVQAGSVQSSGTTLGSASTDAGTAVKDEVILLTGRTFGTATLTVTTSTETVDQTKVTVPKSKDDTDGKANAKIVVETRDYKITGWIYAYGGGITWEKAVTDKNA